MTDEVAIWTPSPFAGTDLLPSAQIAQPEIPDIPIVGRENIEESDIVLPSIRLIQGQSRCLTEVDGAQVGLLHHTGTNEILTPPIRGLVVYHNKSNALFPQDRPEYEGLEKCLSRDGVTGTVYGDCAVCKRCTEWQGKRPPLGQQSHNFVLVTDNGPVIIRFARSSFSSAASFINHLNMSPSKNWWSHPVVVQVFSAQKQLAGGQSTTYFSMDIAWDQSDAIPAEIQRKAYDTYLHFQSHAEEGRFATEDATGE